MNNSPINTRRVKHAFLTAAVCLCSSLPTFTFADIDPPPPLSGIVQTYDLAWSGSIHGNGASAAGSITLDTGMLTIPGYYLMPISAPYISALSITVTGATPLGINGTFGMTDFSSIQIGTNSPLNPNTQLVGQPGFLYFYLEPSTTVAPIGNWEFLLSTSNGAGAGVDLMSLTNFSPHIDLPAVPEPGVPHASQPDPVFLVTDLGPVFSALGSSAPTAFALTQSAFHGSRNGLNVFGQRLNRLWAGHANNIQDGTSNTVVEGQGDGPEVSKSSKSVKNVLPASVQVTKPERWEVYTSFGYSDLDMEEDLSFEGLRSNTYSTGIGAEYALTPYLTLGLGTSYTTSDVKGGGDSGNTDVEGFTFVGYASAYWNHFYADLLYGASFLENDIDRDTGLGSTAHAEPNSVVQSINFNTGYNFYAGNFVTGPYAGIDYAYADVDGYTEHGGGTANTQVSGQTNHSLLTRLGWQASYNIVKPWGRITPQVNAGWERENLNSGDDVTVGLTQSPFYRVQGNSIRSAGGSFSSTVASPGRAADYLTAGAAVVIEVGTRFDVVLDYQGQFFAEDFAAHYAGIKLGYKF